MSNQNGRGAPNGLDRRQFLKVAALGAGAASLGVGFPAVIGRAANQPIRIGALADVTGALYAAGSWGDKAAAAACGQINAKGGIKGRQVEYIREDTATNVQTALRKLRKLVMEDKCDFILGSFSSGINTACAPLVESMEIPHFVLGTALSLTGANANRYTFRGIGNARMSMMALAKVASGQIGKTYYCLGADYEWGRSVVAEFRRVMDPLGGVFRGEEYSPVNTDDFIPYLNKIDPDKVDILVAGYFTADILKLARQAYEKGLLKKMQIVGGAMPTGLAPKDFGPAGPSLWFTGYGVRRMVNLPAELKKYNAPFRQAIGLDDEGRDMKSGEVGAVEYAWAAWEHVYWIKRGIEKSGWKAKSDTPPFIQALEGLSVEAGFDFPQGDKTMRAQDHQAFTDIYISKVEEGNLVIKGRVPAKDLTYPAEVDLTKKNP
ncbi:MAG: ABC transporter substrate-binding protein [Thermodesulfobacteriota bacterium]